MFVRLYFMVVFLGGCTLGCCWDPPPFDKVTLYNRSSNNIQLVFPWPTDSCPANGTCKFLKEYRNFIYFTIEDVNATYCYQLPARESFWCMPSSLTWMLDSSMRIHEWVDQNSYIPPENYKTEPSFLYTPFLIYKVPPREIKTP